MRNLYKALTISFLLISLGGMSQQLSPVIEWQKSLGGSNDDRASAIIKTPDGGFLVVGSSKSNNGDVTGHHGTITTSDGWVVKLTASGSIEWQKSLGGTADDEFTAALIATDGSYICMGSTFSNDGDVSGNHGDRDIWIVKLSRQGNLIWQKCFGGSGAEKPGSIRFFENKYYFIGTTTSGDGNVISNHPNNEDVWIFNFNDMGDFTWGKAFGGSGADRGYDIAGVADGYKLLAVETISADGDFGGLVLNTPASALVLMDNNWVYKEKQGFSRTIVKSVMTANDSTFFSGSHQVVCYPANPAAAASVNMYLYRRNSRPLLGYGGGAISLVPPCVSIISNPTKNYYFDGYSAVGALTTADVFVAASTDDPVIGSRGGIDGIVATTHVADSLLWKKIIGGTGEDRLRSISVIDETQLVAAGYSNSNNGDVSGNHGSFDVWVVKLGRVNSITGNVFLDYNVNGIRDAGEPFVNNYLVESQKGDTKAGSLTASGIFNNLVDTGTYITRVIKTDAYYTAVPASSTSSFTSYNNVNNISFAMQPIPGKRNYKINFFATELARPGFNTSYRVVYTNIGTDTLQNRAVRLIKDSRMNFLSASVAPASVVADTVTWIISSLNPRESSMIDVQLKIAAPPVVNISDRLNSTASIDTTGDLEPANNIARISQPVNGSYDPNDKSESLGGELPVTDASSSALTYTIRFQNTGNDTAFTVVVKDTLSANLDWSTIQMLSATHNYQLSIKNGNELTWTFNNIMLVDSIHNEPMSHGFLSYTIKPRAGIAVGDLIRNSASIYFDFNLPVITNTHETVVRPVFTPQPALSGIAAGYCSTQGLQKGKISNLPASGSGVNVTVKLDGNALAIAADSTFSFDVSTLAAGAHSIGITYSTVYETKTATANFNITAAVTPDVNVFANYTTLSNLNDAVVITASNAAGGGAGPLYTFAKDRAFTNIVQAESANNVFNTTGNNLQTGDNWFYVRMKTNAACFTSQFNIDSIKITLQLAAPNTPVITGVKASYCRFDGVQKAKLTNYPAPGTGTTVTVKVNLNTVAVDMTDTSFKFDPITLQLNNNNNVIQVTYSNATANRTSTVTFGVLPMETPMVKLSASETNASDGQVAFTATQQAGGGNTPSTYVFATDRNFTNIIRPEATENVFTVNVSSLKPGDNKIFVRMKTSAACYTQQTAIDSIVITRTSATGIVDPDYPNQRISANPNPFRSQLQVYGLNASKSYTITVYTQQGKVIGKVKTAGRPSQTLYIPGYSADIYTVSIYDETKNRLIGNLQVVKQ